MFCSTSSENDGYNWNTYSGEVEAVRPLRVRRRLTVKSIEGLVYPDIWRTEWAVKLKRVHHVSTMLQW
jgi:hypothetical protein